MIWVWSGHGHWVQKHRGCYEWDPKKAEANRESTALRSMKRSCSALGRLGINLHHNWSLLRRPKLCLRKEILVKGGMSDATISSSGISLTGFQSVSDISGASLVRLKSIAFAEFGQLLLALIDVMTEGVFFAPQRGSLIEDVFPRSGHLRQFST